MYFYLLQLSVCGKKTAFNQHKLTFFIYRRLRCRRKETLLIKKMKFIYIILVITAFMGASCSSGTVVLSEDDLPENVLYLPNQIKPYTGKAVIYFNNTETIKEVMNFRNGVLHGERIRYYKNGTVKQKGEYKDGCFNGKWIANKLHGERYYEVIYENDTLEGVYISWYQSGVIKEKAEFSNNIVVGEALCYDEAGMRLLAN